LKHAYELADNVVSLITLNHALSLRVRIADMDRAGFGIKEVLLCPTPAPPWACGGFQLGAVHFRRGYHGEIAWGWLDNRNGGATSTEKSPSSSGSLAGGGLNNPSAVAGDKYSGWIRLLTPDQGTEGSVVQFPKSVFIPQQKGTVTTLFWACRRPLTKHWGSGDVWPRIGKEFGPPDGAFGKTDGIPDGIAAYDLSNGYDWKRLPLPDNYHEFGFWDPPYDRMYRQEAMEIWRVCRRLAILHPLIYPTSWFSGGRREAMVAVTLGPLKMIRCLQIFTKN